MKKWLCAVFMLCCVVPAYSQTVPADAILEFVRSKLPNDPLKLTGTLKQRAPNGHTTSLPVVMELDWGAAVPTAAYSIGEPGSRNFQSLTITWPNGKPSYAFSNPANKPTTEILDTGITWADLSFSVFWWPNSKLVDEGPKLNRECYIVDVPVPGTPNTMRLWIEKNMGMLLEARTLDARQKELSRLNIVSIKKMDGMWVAKDLKIEDKKTGQDTTLKISDLEWKNGPPAAEAESAEAFDPAQSVNELASDLYRKLAAGNDGNLFFSPYSISSALAMTYGGARGETAEQMSEVLHFGGPDATHPAFAYLRRTLNNIQEKSDIQLNIANALWLQQDYTILPEYLRLVKKHYGSGIQPVDYKTKAAAARTRINTWVEELTHDKIQNFIAEGTLDPLTRLVLVNAIYFKGNWAAPFKPDATRPAPFTLADGTKVDVPMMSQTADFKLASTDQLQALELPYEGSELSMIVLLPNPGEKLDLVSLDDLEFHEREVAVQLPKFKLESTFSLDGTLASMGMPLAFSDQADFSGMDGTRNLYIGAVLHKAFVEVNEEGTEAAAATGVVIRAVSVPPQFIANRPFLFLIRENSTGTIFFIGRVTDPSK